MKAGDDGGDAGLPERRATRVGANVDDARLTVRVVGLDAGLIAGEAGSRDADSLQFHRQQAGGDLFADGNHGIAFLDGVGVDLGAQADQTVGLAGHRRNDDDESLVLATVVFDSGGDRTDAINGANGGPSVFLNNQFHFGGAILSTNAPRPYSGKSIRSVGSQDRCAAWPTVGMIRVRWRLVRMTENR